ncbi:phosphate/phosphite/phosphonate ABC transporter substrate-binding protein [Marinobacter pelagius]|uniref:PhnD/SsuA/transferrin family substrate-binding protein n=1 Tax=Marinobacter sp. C7 TaxID=2951363 RepID=UPI001EEFA414|nr:PhnD/SsuA/transferrin family substrate-binding protein [Marinobacter sp. C7]MCG7198555.1 phosphate/phosphite/phosphonate ABC transporter substrate-binding protein [Marinobacter sp. C7]
MRISIQSVTEVTDVAGYRLTRQLAEGGCEATVQFGEAEPDAVLEFRIGETAIEAVLVASNRNGDPPRPAWVTRRTAGVGSITELAGRDLATVAGPDPLGARLPLAALAEVGVRPAREQLYEAGDYSSALGLLLHNNTHAAVTEVGFVEPMLENNGLVVTWAGNPVRAGGWYRGAGWNRSALACEEVLAGLTRRGDRQIFMVFPEWVHGFARPERLNSEEVSQ